MEDGRVTWELSQCERKNVSLDVILDSMKTFLSNPDLEHHERVMRLMSSYCARHHCMENCTLRYNGHCLFSELKHKIAQLVEFTTIVHSYSSPDGRKPARIIATTHYSGELDTALAKAVLDTIDFLAFIEVKGENNE